MQTTEKVKETVQPAPATVFPVKNVKVKVSDTAPHHASKAGEVIEVVPALAEKMEKNGWGKIVKS